MNHIPSIFGFPLWEGNIKNRVATKKMNRYKYSMLDTYKWRKKNQPDFVLKVGGLINDCSGFNIEIAEILPDYWQVKGKAAFMLQDFTIVSTTGGNCSFKHCGVEMPLSQEEVERRHVNWLKSYFDGGHAERWHGGQTDKFLAEKEKADKEIQLIESGGHITDSRGVRIKKEI